MAIIYSNVSNEKYSVCCMGQTVYVYAGVGSEVARFTLVHASFSAISPNGDYFAVKNKDGCVAVYSFDSLSRVKTLKYSDKEAQYERGMCFSNNGEFFYNVEDGALSVYNAKDFSYVGKIIFNFTLTHIESNDNGVFVLGIDGEKYFTAKLGDEIKDIKYISEQDFNDIYSYKCAQIRGFSEAAVDFYLPKCEYLNKTLNPIYDCWLNN